MRVETDAGYTFTGWTGDLQRDATTCNMTLNGDKTVGATLNRNGHPDDRPSTGGTIRAAPAGPYHYGDVVVLTLRQTRVIPSPAGRVPERDANHQQHHPERRQDGRGDLRK